MVKPPAQLLVRVMPLSIYDAMPFNQPRPWGQFIRDHMARHQLYSLQMAQPTDPNLSTNPIPMFFLAGNDVTNGAIREMTNKSPDRSFRTWALRHSQIHAAEITQLSALGESSMNVSEWSALAYPDFTTPKSMAEWMFYHGYVHDLTDLALGI